MNYLFPFYEGTNNLAANSFLKQEYTETLSLEQGLDLGVKAIVKTMDTSNPSASKSKEYF